MVANCCLGDNHVCHCCLLLIITNFYNIFLSFFLLINLGVFSRFTSAWQFMYSGNTDILDIMMSILLLNYVSTRESIWLSRSIIKKRNLCFYLENIKVIWRVNNYIYRRPAIFYHLLFLSHAPSHLSQAVIHLYTCNLRF